MPSPIHRQGEATAAAAEQDVCYCLVPVSIDRQTWQTTHLSLPDGTSIPIPRRLEQKDLLSYEEAEQIRPGVAHRITSSLAPFLTFRREDRALVAPIVSPDSASGGVGGAKGRHSARSHQNLVSTKRSLFSNAPVASKVLEVATLGAPPIDLCDSDDSISEKRNTRSRKFSNTKKSSRSRLKAPGSRSSRKKKARKTRYTLSAPGFTSEEDDGHESDSTFEEETDGGDEKSEEKAPGSRSSRKKKARKTRYTLSAPGFTSEEDDGHESDSTFEEETDGGDDKSEEEGSHRVLRPKSIRRARLNYGEGGDDDDRNSDDDNANDDTGDDEHDDAHVLTNDDDESSVPVDVQQLFCSWCGEHHNKDDFSLQQQANLNDQYRFCLLHHGVGHQTTYEGTSSVRKLASQIDEIGEKYKDVGSDDEVIGDSDFSSDADEYLEENNNNVTNSGNTRKCSPKRIKKMAEGLLGEESESDEDAFANDEHLHTQPPCVFDDDDDDDGNEELHGEKYASQPKRRRCITDDE